MLEGNFVIMAPPDLILDSTALTSEAASSGGITRAPQARAVACTRELGPFRLLFRSERTPANGPKSRKLLCGCLMGSAGQYEIGTASIGAASKPYGPSAVQ